MMWRARLYDGSMGFYDSSERICDDQLVPYCVRVYLLGVWGPSWRTCINTRALHPHTALCLSWGQFKYQPTQSSLINIDVHHLGWFSSSLFFIGSVVVEGFPTCLYLDLGLFFYTAAVSTYLGFMYVHYFTWSIDDAYLVPFLVLTPIFLHLPIVQTQVLAAVAKLGVCR